MLNNELSTVLTTTIIQLLVQMANKQIRFRFQEVLSLIMDQTVKNKFIFKGDIFYTISQDFTLQMSTIKSASSSRNSANLL